jgi:AraC family transcriptional regulator
MHFAAQFKAATGQTPHAYVVSRKIIRAKQMLMDSTRAIGEVALELNFSSSAHFTQVFKCLVGETPGSWRRRQEISVVRRADA